MWARVSWQADVLVFETTLSRGGQAGTDLARYVLEDGGKTLRAFEKLRSATLNYDNVWVLRRNPAG